MLRLRVAEGVRAGLSQRALARQLHVSRAFVARWAGTAPAAVGRDGRGWPRGRGRRWSPALAERVGALVTALRADPREFFHGATAVQQAYRRTYPGEPVPALRTVGRVLRQLGLTTPRRGRCRGASARLAYPDHLLTQLGPRRFELDWIGPKYLTGGPPLTFLGLSCAEAPRLRHFTRVPSATTAPLLAVCSEVFAQYEVPHVLKVDNAAAAIGSTSAPRTLSRFVAFLLQAQIQPVFAVPRRPFSQASIEGNNSVFARCFWRRRHFTSLADLDAQLQWFNAASRRYTSYQPPPPRPRPPFVPQLHFLRQVQETTHGTGIALLNTFVPLAPVYTELFVLATWHLPSEQLRVYLQQDRRKRLLRRLPFPIHPQSRARVP